MFIELALVDLRRAADFFGAVFDNSNQVYGWVSMEVSLLPRPGCVASSGVSQRGSTRALARSPRCSSAAGM
jgi:hypothetical protein